MNVVRRIVMKDPIVEEVRRAREAHAKQFNYDLDAIGDDLKKREKESGVPTVSLPPRRAAKKGKPPASAPDTSLRDVIQTRPENPSAFAGPGRTERWQELK